MNDIDEQCARATVAILSRRLQSLESKVRLLERSAAVSIALVVALVAMGASPAARVPDALSAVRFQLVADDGHVVGAWEQSSSGTMRLVTLDSQGRVNGGIELAQGKAAASIVLPAQNAAPSKTTAIDENRKPTAQQPKGENEEEEDDDAFDWVQ